MKYFLKINVLASIVSSICFIFTASYYYGIANPYFTFDGVNSIVDYPTLLFLFSLYSIPIFLVIGAPLSYLLEKIILKLSDRMILRLLLGYLVYLLAGALISILFALTINVFVVFIVKAGLVASTMFYMTINLIRFLVTKNRKTISPKVEIQ